VKKANKSSWIFLIGAALVLSCICLLWLNSQQSGKYDEVSAEAAAAKDKLNLINNNDLLAQKAKLEQDIVNAENSNNEISQTLSSANDSISATDTILNEASKYGIDIISMNSSGITEGYLKELPCTIQTIQMTVNGTMPSLADFVTSFNKTFPTCMIESFEMTVREHVPVPAVPVLDESGNPAPNQAPAAAVDDGKDTQAILSLTIYNYKGE
jgi:hypothetical protein